MKNIFHVIKQEMEEAIIPTAFFFTGFHLVAFTKAVMLKSYGVTAGGYTVLQGDFGRLDLHAGFRYFDVEASTDWRLTADVNGPGGGKVFSRTGSISKNEDIWDGVIGVRGLLNLGGSKFYVPYYFDIGIGSSEVTWEGMVGLGYDFKWVDFLLAYRHLYYDMGDDELVQDMRFSGPGLALTFRF